MTLKRAHVVNESRPKEVFETRIRDIILPPNGLGPGIIRVRWKMVDVENASFDSFDDVNPRHVQVRNPDSHVRPMWGLWGLWGFIERPSRRLSWGHHSLRKFDDLWSFTLDLLADTFQFSHLQKGKCIWPQVLICFGVMIGWLTRWRSLSVFNFPYYSLKSTVRFRVSSCKYVASTPLWPSNRRFAWCRSHYTLADWLSCHFTNSVAS